MFRSFPTIPGLLGAAGYRTGIIGKLHVNPASAFPFDMRWNDPKFCSFSRRDVRKIAAVAREFPGESWDTLPPASRRSFLKVMGASLAFAGLTACRWPEEEILPFAARREPVGQTEEPDGATVGGVDVDEYEQRAVEVLDREAPALVIHTGEPEAAEIGAIGKLSPRDGILNLVGTPGARVDRILVKPHDVVSSGDVLILLDNHDLLDAERELASIELEAIKQTTEDKIRLQQAMIQSAQIQLKHSRQSLAEYRSLGANAMAKMELSKRQNAVEEAKSNVAIETARLKQIQQEQKFERLKAAGMTFHSEPKSDGNTRMAYGRDPDGNVVELLEVINKEDPALMDV